MESSSLEWVGPPAPSAPETELDLLHPDRDRAKVRSIWCALEARCRPRYFLSWAWIETWLDTLPSTQRPQLAIVRYGSEPVAAFFVSLRTTRRYGLLRSRAGFVNETGAAEHDLLRIEHNGWLCRPDVELDVGLVLRRLPVPWEELTLSALDSDGVPGHGLASLERDFFVRVVSVEPAPYVDLAAVRSAGDYLSLVGESTRANIRRSRRAYEGRGALVLESPKSLGEALGYLDELAALSAARFRDGAASAFRSAYFLRFHRELIARRFGLGEIQLLRLRAGETTIGVLYNHVQRGVVHFYQCGLRYEQSNRYKPGLLLHAEAIQHNAGAGLSIYDFLAGSARYKQELSTHSTTLVWARVQRRLAKFALEARLRSLRAWVRAQLRSMSVSP